MGMTIGWHRPDYAGMQVLLVDASVELDSEPLDMTVRAVEC
jgi:hypothetical protein